MKIEFSYSDTRSRSNGTKVEDRQNTKDKDDIDLLIYYSSIKQTIQI